MWAPEAPTHIHSWLKDGFPVDSVGMDDVYRKYFDFASFVGALKEVERWRGQFYWREYPQRERYDSVADHSWRLALLVAMIAPRLAQPIDLGKALTMALIHDVPEIIAGDASPIGELGTGADTHAYNPAVAAARHEKECVAAKTIFAKLPNGEGDRLLALWNECEEQSSFEARVIKALDKIEALLQVIGYQNGNLFPEHLDFTISYALKFADVDPAVRALANETANELRARFTPFTRP